MKGHGRKHEWVLQREKMRSRQRTSQPQGTSQRSQSSRVACCRTLRGAEGASGLSTCSVLQLQLEGEGGGGRSINNPTVLGSTSYGHANSCQVLKREIKWRLHCGQGGTMSSASEHPRDGHPLSPQWKVRQVEGAYGKATKTPTSPATQSYPKRFLFQLSGLSYYPIFMLLKQATSSLQPVVWFLMRPTLKFFYHDLYH